MRKLLSHLILALFVGNSFAEIYLDCKNPERFGYKKDFYLLKIFDDFEEFVYQEKGSVEVKRIVHFKTPNAIGINDYGKLEILRGESKYSLMSERKFEAYEDFWQIYRNNLKLEITRTNPYKEFNGKCKVIDSKKYSSIIEKYTKEQIKLEGRLNQNNRI